MFEHILSRLQGEEGGVVEEPQDGGRITRSYWATNDIHEVLGGSQVSRFIFLLNLIIFDNPLLF